MGNPGRKRPAEMAEASAAVGDDEGHSTSRDKKHKSGRKKKDKKRKDGKGKGHKSSSSSSSKTKDGSSGMTSLETTATAEGKQMAQVLSTFSKLEQSRFEAFRKAAFPADAIAKYVAHCLVHEQHRPLSGSAAIGGGDAASRARQRHLRPTAHQRRSVVLAEVVAPGQAGDIAVVVSTLAKEYVQRLVLAARKHATERQRTARQKRMALENENEADDVSDDYDSADEDPALAPSDILRAHAERQARGLDPGFFLPGSSASASNARAFGTAFGMADPQTRQRYSQTLAVAREAQERYDQDQEKDEGEATPDEARNDAMELDNDSEDVNMAKEAEDTEEKSFDEEDDEEDASERAVRLFAMHVNRVIARQNGIHVVTSDDEQEEKAGAGAVAGGGAETDESGNGLPTETETKGDAPASASAANDSSSKPPQNPLPGVEPPESLSTVPSSPLVPRNSDESNGPNLKEAEATVPMDTDSPAPAAVATEAPTAESEASSLASPKVPNDAGVASVAAPAQADAPNEATASVESTSVVTKPTLGIPNAQDTNQDTSAANANTDASKPEAEVIAIDDDDDE